MVEEAHGLLQAGRACGARPSGQRDAKGHVVYVRVCRGAGVGDGVGETVVATAVLLASGSVQWLVRSQAVIDGKDERVLAGVVVAAIAVLDELGGIRAHDGAAHGLDHSARSVQGFSDASHGFGGGEEGHGVLDRISRGVDGVPCFRIYLKKDAERHAGGKGVVIQHRSDENRAIRFRVIVPQTTVQRNRQAFIRAGRVGHDN